jgi:hypothetical protein
VQAVVDPAQVDQHLGGVRHDLGVGGLGSTQHRLVGDQILGDREGLVEPAEGAQRVHPAEPAHPVGAAVTEQQRDRFRLVGGEQRLRVVATDGQVVHVQGQARMGTVRRHQHRQPVHRHSPFPMALWSAVPVLM